MQHKYRQGQPLCGGCQDQQVSDPGAKRIIDRIDGGSHRARHYMRDDDHYHAVHHNR